MMRAVVYSMTLGIAFGAGCSAPPSQQDLIFVDGRAVASAGDSVVAITQQGDPRIILRDRETGAVYSRGRNVVTSPHQVQEMGGRWYVSDVEDDEEWIVVFDAQWEVLDRLRVDTLGVASHQFAVLPDGRIVLEAGSARLVALGGDTVSTFAIFDPGPRTGFLVAASGGVLHAVPDRYVTLYNENGNLRWRLPWQWRENVYVADLAVDPRGRFHMLIGEGTRNSFVCFSLSAATGEVLRWSEPGPVATFAVDRLGEVTPDSLERWIEP